MAEKNASYESTAISRRAAIKAAATAALTGGLIACQDKITETAQKTDATAQEVKLARPTCHGTDDHTGMLGVWLALVRDGRYCDRDLQNGQGIGTWDPGTRPDSIASALVPDMFPTLNSSDQAAIVPIVSQMVTLLRQPLPRTPTSVKDMYAMVGDHLAKLSSAVSAYSGADCPRFYSTIQAIARVRP